MTAESDDSWAIIFFFFSIGISHEKFRKKSVGFFQHF